MKYSGYLVLKRSRALNRHPTVLLKLILPPDADGPRCANSRWDDDRLEWGESTTRGMSLLFSHLGATRTQTIYRIIPYRNARC